MSKLYSTCYSYVRLNDKKYTLKIIVITGTLNITGFVTFLTQHENDEQGAKGVN